MTIDPTHEEWLAAYERLQRLGQDWYEANPDETISGPSHGDVVKAILGPCPPEPAITDDARRALEAAMVKRAAEALADLWTATRRTGGRSF